MKVPTSQRPAPARSRLSILLSILLLASLACTLPALGAQTTPGAVTPTGGAPSGSTPVGATQAAATPTSAIQAQGGKPRKLENLPPALVESDPLPGSEIGPSNPVTLAFNQPMERSTVEAALQGEPQVGGRFEWLDDATVRFTPDRPFPADRAVKLTVGTGARAANGVALPEAASLSFQVAGSLHVSERLPKPGAADANPSSAVVVTFDRPVTALGADPSSLPPAFTLQPQADGRGEWINTSTYIFYPAPSLSGGVEYTIQLDPNLKSGEGSPLSLEGLQPADWTFRTALPAVLGVNIGDRPSLELDGKIVVTFNQPMDPASVAGALKLVQASGAAAASFKLSWDERNTAVTLTPDGLLARGTTYTLVVTGQAKGQGGTPIGQEFSYPVNTVPALAVASTIPPQGETINTTFGLANFVVNFTAPLAEQNLDGLVKVDPPVSSLSTNLTYDQYGISVQGAFQPSTQYTLSLSPDLKDRWGGTLGNIVQLSFATQAATPSLTIPIAQLGAPAIFVPQGQTSLPARVTNLNQVNLALGKLIIQEFIDVISNGKWPGDLSSRPAQRWSAALEAPVNRNVAVDLPLTSDGKPLDSGLFFYFPQAPGINEATPLPYLVISSRLQITFKVSARQAMAWVVDLATQKPVNGARVDVLDGSAAVLATCTTDAQGICQTDMPQRKNAYDNLYAVTGQPGGAGFGLAASNMNQGVSSWEFGLPVNYDFNPEKIYLYTDRPIYRPGQELNFRAVLRKVDNTRYSAVDTKEVEVRIMPPYDYTSSEQAPLTTLRLPVSPYGTANGTYKLPADALPGYYSIDIPDPNTPQGSLATLSFQVAEYRKPEFDLQVAFDKIDYQAGEVLNVKVSARYFFDAPVSNLPLIWTLFAAQDYLYLTGGLQTGKMDTSWLSPYPTFNPGLGQFIVQGQGLTAPDGSLQLNLKPEDLKLLDASRRQNLVLEVTATDESNLPVSARGRATLHPASFYAGVRAEAWSVQAGDELGFTIQTVDWSGNPSGNHSLTASFSKVRWVRDDTQSSAIGYTVYKPEYTPVASTDLRTDGLGRARATFTPPDPGTYQIEVSGEGAATQLLVWVGGAGLAPWPDLPNQRLRIEADAAEYTPGQTAHIRVPNPAQGKTTLALVTVERGKVMRAFVQEINSSLAVVDVPVEDIDAPNAYVAVTVLNSQPGTAPDFRQGYVKIAVKADALKLDVKVTAPARSLPGQEVKLDVQVKDSAGKPVQGEFSLALVDKAVLALADPNAPGIFEAFYGEQPLGVSTSLNLTGSASRVQALAADGRGGGGGGEAANPSVRQNFQDAAAWFGSIETNADGLAEVSVRLPDNLTAWVANLRGLTADTRVGEATVEVVTSKDLLVRPVAPRFLVVGDRVQLGAIVQNNSAQSLTVDVGVEAPGLTVEDSGGIAQRVDVPAGGRARVNFWATVQDVDSVDPVFSARSGSLEDVTHTEQGALPVLHYSSPQTFATAGVLAEGGERLEVVSLPRSFKPTGGQLDVELTPSLSSTVLEGLKALEAFPDDFTEPVISRLLPNVAAYQALKSFNLNSPDLLGSLEKEIRADLRRLVELQHPEGGWSWSGRGDEDRDPYVTAYAVFTLSQASKAGFFVQPDTLERAKSFLAGNLYVPAVTLTGPELDRLAFETFALQENDQTTTHPDFLYEQREKLSPWGKALLALTLEGQQTGSPRAKTLVSDLEGGAVRSATGASWQSSGEPWFNWSTANFTTAVTSYALARLDPATPLLVDAARYLVLQRQPNGCWSSSYESAWVLLALTETLKSTGDVQANFNYAASLNDAVLATGSPQTPASALNPVTAVVPLGNLLPEDPNALKISRDAGDGRLYYRAFLQVDRPVETAPALARGVFVQRDYYQAGQDCKDKDCKPVTETTLGPDSGLVVRLTVTVPNDVYYLVVEDTIPSGTEIINPNLKTSQQGFQPVKGIEGGPGEPIPLYDLADPFGGGWGWWRFGQAQIHDERVRWIAPYLPAGTYQLTYRLAPTLAGEFRTIPARAYEYYFPDVQGSSAGGIFVIK